MNDDPDSSQSRSRLPSIAVAITVEAPGWRARVPDVEALVRRAVRAAVLAAVAAQHEPAARWGAGVEISVLLSDDARVRDLNRRYRGRDAPTNVLSFPAGDEGTDEAPVLLGDVVLALETVAREAAGQAKPLGDHVAHLIVHGVLHLLGYDHESDAAAALMEALEVRILSALEVPDPYAPAAATPGGEDETTGALS
ncbi:MAG: rRNA maturation RNase YbeY [Alphaproteobacteria bacterium]|nr:MAG: rRNA maturation RNase YbeY [Alphaproteobacteria bacterium]